MLIDTVTGREAVTLKGNAGSDHSIAFSRSRLPWVVKMVASGGSDGTVRLWDSSNGKELLVLRGHAMQSDQWRFPLAGISSYQQVLTDSSCGRFRMLTQR